MYRKYKLWLCWLVLLFILLILSALLAVTTGSADISKEKIFSLLISGIKGEYSSSPEATIIFNIRIPRLVLGFMVGGALALVGVIFQGLFRNPLVEPYTLGISGGAALVVSLCISFGLSRYISLPIAGWAGALLAIFLVYVIAGRSSRLRITGLLLVGVMFSFISSSLIMLVLSVAKSEQAHGILFWIMGNLRHHDIKLLKVICFIIPIGAIITFMKAWKLNALSLGEEDAMHMGVDVEKAKKEFFLYGSFLAGVAVSVSGIIGFVGLVVPHFIRLLVGSDHRILMPSSFLLGGIFLVICDTIARTVIAPVELPVGVITGIVGGSIFIYFLIRKQWLVWRK